MYYYFFLIPIGLIVTISLMKYYRYKIKARSGCSSNKLPEVETKVDDVSTAKPNVGQVSTAESKVVNQVSTAESKVNVASRYKPISDKINNSSLEEACLSYNVKKILDYPFKYENALNLKPDIVEDELGVYLEIFIRFIGYLEATNAYLNNDLNIVDAAQSIFSNKTYISRAVRIYSGVNFCQLINAYRVQYSIKLFNDDKYLRITELADMSGFNSSTRFVSYFKSYMKMSPSEWCKNIRQDTFMNVYKDN